MKNDKQNDIDALRRLNVELGDAESQGNRGWFEGIIAPELAFRRADGKTFDNRAAFLAKIKRSDKRETEIESVEIYGDRAVIKCIVTVKSEKGDRKSFHNLRLFARHDGEWKLLGWANEPQ